MKEQNEKQAIEEMAQVMYDILPGYDLTRRDCIDAAEVLFAKGYHKQSVGEWKYNPNGMDWGLGAWQCSLCGCNNNILPMNKRVNPMQFAGAKYCPNCGAIMKGGE